MSLRKKQRNAVYWQANAATLPAFIPELEQKLALLEHRASIIWSPTSRLTDACIEQYLNMAASTHKIEEEQALYILRQQQYNLELAQQRLSCTQTARGCRYHRWKAHELLSLAKAFKEHGDDFEQVHKLLPQFPIPDLRQYFKYAFAT